MKIRIIAILAALAVLAASHAFADSDPVLAHITACPSPDNQSMLKSETITVTKNEITFDVVNGSWRIQQGAPATESLSYPVTSVESVTSPHPGIEVTYTDPLTFPEDGQNEVKTLRIYSDSTQDGDYGTLYSKDCQ